MEIIDQAKEVLQMTNSCCASDIWGIFSPDA